MMLTPTIADRVPGDDTLWVRYRTLSNRALAEVLGVDQSWLARHLGERGWRRKGGYKLIAAPCRVCGESFPVKPDTTDRICGKACAKVAAEATLSPAARLYREELAARRARLESSEGRERYARIGGPRPDALTMRRARKAGR